MLAWDCRTSGFIRKEGRDLRCTRKRGNEHWQIKGTEILHVQGSHYFHVSLTRQPARQATPPVPLQRSCCTQPNSDSVEASNAILPHADV